MGRYCFKFFTSVNLYNLYQPYEVGTFERYIYFTYYIPIFKCFFGVTVCLLYFWYRLHTLTIETMNFNSLISTALLKVSCIRFTLQYLINSKHNSIMYNHNKTAFSVLRKKIFGIKPKLTFPFSKYLGQRKLDITRVNPYG